MNTIGLKQYKVSDTRELHRLVQSNAEMLATDFPQVPGRYSTLLKSARSIARAIRNQDLQAFTIYEGVTRLVNIDHASLRDMVVGKPEMGNTLYVEDPMEMVGVGTLMPDDSDKSIAIIAGWVDKRHQGHGIAHEAGRMLLAQARLKGYTAADAYVRPENEPSLAVVHDLGFSALGDPGVVDLGDGVSANRQRFHLKIA